MRKDSFLDDLKNNTYPGRGIAAGLSADGKKAAAAYFIMGRSENSRNRIFTETGDGIKTEAFDPARLTDPSLIIYSPVRMPDSRTMIVTNGDQTDTIYDGLKNGLTFEQSLESRTFEPDAPNYTPRISALLDIKGGKLKYQISILKSLHGDPAVCVRELFSFDAALPGRGHFISTYLHDGNPLPSFTGEPEQVSVPDDAKTWADDIWDALNSENKVSLFVRFINLETASSETVIINKNSDGK